MARRRKSATGLPAIELSGEDFLKGDGDAERDTGAMHSPARVMCITLWKSRTQADIASP